MHISYVLSNPNRGIQTNQIRMTIVVSVSPADFLKAHTNFHYSWLYRRSRAPKEREKNKQTGFSESF